MAPPERSRVVTAATTAKCHFHLCRLHGVGETGWRATAIHDRRLALGGGINPRTSKRGPMKLTINDDLTRGPKVEIEEDGRDMFVVVNGITIARRGDPGTPEAATWVVLEPGWTVTSSEDLSRIEIMYNGKQVVLH
jgi:hypothetical protein